MGIMGIPTITHYNLAFLSIARASAICAEKSILSLPLLTLSALFTKRTASSPVNVGITFISNAIVLYIYLGAKLLLIFQIAKLFLVFLWSPMSNTGQRCINSLIIGAGLHKVKTLPRGGGCAMAVASGGQRDGRGRAALAGLGCIGLLF